MKIIIPEKIISVVDEFKRKDVRVGAYKIVLALLRMNERRNEFGWFDVPSRYLSSINKRYKRTIDKLIAEGILIYYTRPQTSENDIFSTIQKKYYNTTLGVCMKYKFLIDTEVGQEWDFCPDNPNRKRWYDIIKTSLISLGYEPTISRDTFGRRVHHPAIYDYKDNLKGRGFSIIDAECSQPRLLYLIMKEKNIIDTAYFSTFESGYDFYNVLIDLLNLEGGRKEAKDLFMYWTGGKSVFGSKIWKLYPGATNFIKTLKCRSYKNAAAFLQREEAKIWIDDLLENIPCDFALPIHDALIVKGADVALVLDYCRKKYPEINFHSKEL